MGSKLLPSSFKNLLVSASSILGLNLSLMRCPWPYLPLELKPYPITGFPFFITSEHTATKLNVILEKSI